MLVGEFDTSGSDLGQLDAPQAIVADPSGSTFWVGEQSNNRIQIFDENGKFLEDWRGIKRPYYIYMSEDQHLWISDAKDRPSP